MWNNFLIIIALLVSPYTAQAKKIVLEPSSTVVVSGDIEPMKMSYVLNEVVSKLNPVVPVRLVLYSPGGSLAGMAEMFDFLSEDANIEIVILRAASMACLISQAPGKPRYIHKSGIMLFHHCMVSMDGIPIKRLKKITERFEVESTQFDKMCSNRMKISFDEYLKNIDDKDWQLSPKEAIKVGAADEIVDIECSSAMRKNDIRIVPIPKFDGPMPIMLCKLLDNMNKENLNGTKTKTK